MGRIIALALAALTVTSAWADHVKIEEVVVIGEKDTRIFDLADTVNILPDSAALLKRTVGANVVSNGPLTGIAQIRGMSRFRISTQINGAVISAGGPNWMDPPLSYAPAAHLESLEVYRGIASVAAGQETIGGAIKANTWRGEFAEDGTRFDGRVRTGGQSVNSGNLLSGAFSLASESNLLRMSALRETGEDAEFADGEVLPTEFLRERFDIGYGLRLGDHTVRVDFGRNNTGDAGTPALPMDIRDIDSDLVSASWDYTGERVQLTGKVHTSDIEHGMTNYHLRMPPAAGAMWRRNVASGDNIGFVFSATMDGWIVGVDGHEEVHNSNIDNPNNPMFFVVNFNDTERRILGLFAEREQVLGDGWLAEFGLRYNQVSMDSKTVDATPAAMGMPPAVALRDAFNNADRSQTDHNVDWVVKLNYLMSSSLNYYAGLSRKSRSPSYQERYLWLPLQATAGLADGRTYTGNIELDPEVAHEVELGLDWEKNGWSISPRVFYRQVNDYIQGVASTNMSAVMFVQMMNVMNGTNSSLPLEFRNVDANFYGFDVDWSYAFNEIWSLNGILNYVRGERDDTDDDLYRVAAPNALIAINYTPEKWGLTLEGFIYDGQSHVSNANGEPESSGYGLVNLQGYWQITAGLRLGFGIDNVVDKDYADHLGGINRVAGNPDINIGERLPGFGRNYFARVDYRW